LTKSYENGECDGLDVIPGEVVPLERTENIKIPQIGWNKIEMTSGQDKNTIFNNLDDNSYFYFLHSYQVQVGDKKHSAAETVYGANRFSAVITKDNVSGCQFHPELSATNGLSILRNFTKQ
jgi:glutamine amidotransferase